MENTHKKITNIYVYNNAPAITVGASFCWFSPIIQMTLCTRICRFRYGTLPVEFAGEFIQHF